MKDTPQGGFVHFRWQITEQCPQTGMCKPSNVKNPFDMKISNKYFDKNVCILALNYF